eukprot:CAMPEP_0116960126 /NCGR_PEP_ID=MMETSP0467-20121206/45752_1 /TAXON_ID=283647 /ORGANISM="Mesodinium pulex, Strain SPMC105" /LENGTH=37 /DNA_ID= /DNA_START= /DNA_END= /DNA_ORIENTATION=
MEASPTLDTSSNTLLSSVDDTVDSLVIGSFAGGTNLT